MNLELVTTIFGALLQQQQQQLELVLLLLWVCDHSTGLHGSSYSYNFAIIRNAAGRWMKAAGFLHSFLPEIHVTCHKLGSNPGKNQKQPSHLPPPPPPPKFNPSTDWLTSLIVSCLQQLGFFYSLLPSFLLSILPSSVYLLPPLGTMSQEHTAVHQAGQQEISLTSSLPLLIPAEVRPLSLIPDILNTPELWVYIWTPTPNYLHIPRHIGLSQSHLAIFRIEF